MPSVTAYINPNTTASFVPPLTNTPHTPTPQDGSIGYEIKLTGELSTNAISEGEDPLNPTHGTLVMPGVNAQHHQHMFCMRLDMAVDDTAGGQGLVVSEVGAGCYCGVSGHRAGAKGIKH
jgi:hypothetical protein